MPIPQSDIGEFLENLSEGFLVADSAGLIMFVNQRLSAMFEYTSQELLGSPVETLIPEKHRETHVTDRKAFFSHPHPRAMGAGRDLMGRKKSGEKFPIEVSLAPISSVMAYALVSDISGRKAIERSLEEERNFTSAVLETLGALVVVLDRDGRIVRFNRACRETTGYSAEDISEIWDLIPDDDLEDERARFRDLVSRGKPEPYEGHWETREGRRRRIAWSNTVIHDSSGKVLNVVATGIDVTERRRLEEQYIQAQKMEAVGRLAGGVAHDFNNILNVISVDSDMLMDKLEDPDSRELLEEISKVIDRGASIVRELLTFSRPQEVEPVVVDLDAIVEDTRRMMQVLLGQAVALEIEKPDSTARVSIDRRQMEQVLMNLAANARDAMPDGGTLSFTIALEMVSREASHTLGIGPGKFVRMAVRDTGTGIDDVVRGRIFEPFFTTKEVGKGTGLGLSTTYGIITRAGGTIRCESKPDAGTTFYVYLPVAEGRGFTGGGTA